MKEVVLAYQDALAIKKIRNIFFLEGILTARTDFVALTLFVFGVFIHSLASLKTSLNNRKRRIRFWICSQVFLHCSEL